MRFGINWAVIIPTAIFFILWLLQSALSTLYEAIKASCSEKIVVAYQVLSLSTVISAGAVAWTSYRFNTAIYKGKE